MNDETIRRDVLIAYEYAYLHEDWVTPLEEALDGLTAGQALWHPVANSKSVWEIVLHVAVWAENIVERIETGKNTHPSEGAWPEVPTMRDESAWTAAKQRLWTGMDSVRSLLESTPMAQIESSPYGLPDLLCRVTHVAYHIGQITKIREWMDSGQNEVGRSG